LRIHTRGSATRSGHLSTGASLASDVDGRDELGHDDVGFDDGFPPKVDVSG
jgi:hypothetical protein